MTLLQVIRAIEVTAAAQPSVSCIVRNDVFRLNAYQEARYGAFAWLQGEHFTSEEEGLIRYSFTLFYVDRLTPNHGNEIEVQSTGMETLQNVLRSLAALGVYPTDYSFRTFNERFHDECAGVFCTVTLEAQKEGLCPEAYENEALKPDFQMAFNDDYKAWELRVSDNKTIFVY